MINMKSKLLTAALFSLAAAFSLQAQTVSANDIIVGVRNSGANNLEIKAGSVSTLQTFSTETLIGNYNSSLTAAIGATWSTATNSAGAIWGAGGSSGQSTQVYASSLWDLGSAGTLGVANNDHPWNGFSSLGTAATKFGSVNTGFNSSSATATADAGAKTILAGNANSWSLQGGTGAAAFNNFNPNNGGFAGVAAANAAALGTNYSALDLYQVVVNGSTFLGTFALYTADGGGHNVGDLTFTAFTAIPEPSTYAALLGAVTLGVVVIRRRQQSQTQV